MEVSIYFAIGIILGIERLSRVTKDEEQGMVSIGIMAIIVLWPLYIVYKIVKKRRNKQEIINKQLNKIS